ncbi:MAG: Lrp/AsnC ligand binding domain-containing protein [Thermoplasmata archaeon]|nr:Lrp/AsnC ligand binding domain-containing protein [Thermoplasmata archaeon]
MVAAVVLVKVEPNMERTVFQELKERPEVKDAHQILGLFDIYLKVSCRTYDEISNLVLNTIRNLPGVIDTRTLPEAQFNTL